MHLEYKAFFDRPVGRQKHDDDFLYVHNDFVSPGNHTYYVIIPDGLGNFKFIKHFESFVKERKEQIPYRSMPKANQEEDDEQVVNKSQYPEVIRSQWKTHDQMIDQTIVSDL